MGGIKQNVVVSRSVADLILSSPEASSAAIIDYVMEKVFGDRGAIRRLKPEYFRELRNAATLREPFATEALADEIRLIERETPNLVSFCRSLVDQALWERESHVKVVEATDSPTCEANLFSLIRDFTAYITTSVFMGQAFIESSFSEIENLWTMDDRFLSLFTGVPRWFPSPGVSTVHPARRHLLNSLADFHGSIIDWLDGRDPGMVFSDLDDVSEHIKHQALLSKKLGLSPYASASGYVCRLWGLLKDTPKVIFWNLIHICSDRELLEDVRKEITPYAKASRTSRRETGFPIPEQPKVSIDLKGLQESCPILKACYYETMRFDSAGISFRQLTSDLDVAESDSDAALDGLEKPRKYALERGNYIAISHGAYQKDSRYFQNPTMYDYQRFIKTDSESGKKTVDGDAFMPFCDGVFEVKGQQFAESEILAFTAAILALWDISPAPCVGEWKIPRQRPNIGLLSPSKDVRVRIKLRV